MRYGTLTYKKATETEPAGSSGQPLDASWIHRLRSLDVCRIAVQKMLYRRTSDVTYSRQYPPVALYTCAIWR